MSRILYVGTDRTMTEMTGRLLKRNGFDVQCAVGQEKAFAAICTQQFAVVIADLEESVYDGIRFCQKVAQYFSAYFRKREGRRGCPARWCERLAQEAIQYEDIVR